MSDIALSILAWWCGAMAVIGIIGLFYALVVKDGGRR